MSKEEKFNDLIVEGISVISGLTEKSANEDFIERYEKMINELENISYALKRNELYKNFSYLNIVKMLYHGDNEELHQVVNKINNYYMSNFYEDE